MDVGSQKLRKNCDFLGTKWTLNIKNEGNIVILVSSLQRNGRWMLKPEEKLRLYLVERIPFAGHGRWTSKTEVKPRL